MGVVLTTGLIFPLTPKMTKAVSLSTTLNGKILLQVELHGEAWYINPDTGYRYYLKDGNEAYQIMTNQGLGISEADIAKIPVGLNIGFMDTDTDGDGLQDTLEIALNTQDNNPDSDGDSHSDYTEISNDFNPLGSGKLSYSQSIINRVKGKIILQVQNKGQAWYVHPDTGKRYYMKNGDVAFEIMRTFGLGITSADLGNIKQDLGYSHTIDSQHVYFCGNIIEGADAATFTTATTGWYSQGIYYKDNNHVYRNDSDNCSSTILTWADPETFEVLLNNYIKDKDSVYYMVDGEINGADSATFNVLNCDGCWGYAKDQNTVYYAGVKINDSDPTTFEVLNNKYSKDKNYVYHEHSTTNVNDSQTVDKVAGADATTFETLNWYYGKDNSNAYYYGIMIPGVDANTFMVFETIGYQSYAKDKDFVYRGSNIIPGADPATFEIIDQTYSKDANHVYHEYNIVEGADPATFQP